MHLKSVRIRNFRRLNDVLIDLDRDISIFVGANNSGKTSVAQMLQLFVSGFRDRVSIHDCEGGVSGRCTAIYSVSGLDRTVRNDG